MWRSLPRRAEPSVHRSLERNLAVLLGEGGARFTQSAAREGEPLEGRMGSDFATICPSVQARLRYSLAHVHAQANRNSIYICVYICIYIFVCRCIHIYIHELVTSWRPRLVCAANGPRRFARRPRTTNEAEREEEAPRKRAPKKEQKKKRAEANTTETTTRGYRREVVCRRPRRRRRS